MKRVNRWVLGCLSTLCLNASPVQAASTPADALLVLEKDQNTLVIVEPASLKIVGRVPVGDNPHEVAVSADGRTAYISNYGGATIAVVDLVAQKPLAPIDLGTLRRPHGLAFAGGKLYFTAEGAKVVGRYDPASRKIDWVVNTGQDRTHMVLVSKDLRTVFTANVASATVSIIEPSAAQQPSGLAAAADWKVTNVAVGRGSEGFDLSPDGKELWVANARDRTISVIDVASKTVVQTLPSTGNANRLKITLDGKYVFVSDLQSNKLLVIDRLARSKYREITLPGNSEGLLMSPDGLHAYTTLNSRNAVAAIDLKTLSVSGEVTTGEGPDGLAWAARK